jgi:hypothetical protein
MVIVNERNGGFAGMMQSLRLDELNLRVSDKGRLVSERRLETAEAEHFLDLLDKAQAAPPPIDDAEAHESLDAYAVMLSFEGEPEPRVSLSTLTLPVMGAGAEWDELLGWLDRTLTSELRANRPSTSQLLTDEPPRQQ